MTNFTFNGPINGNNHHFGDRYYNSTEEFLRDINDLDVSDVEKELVNIIFENTSSIEERQQILNSLKAIKSGDEISGSEEDTFIEYLKSLVDRLKKNGKSLGVSIVKEAITKVILSDRSLDLIHNIIKSE